MITHRDRCRMCGSKECTMFLDLCDQPPANSNIRLGAWLKHPEPLYPLQVYFCHDCNLVQLLDDVAKEELFSVYQFVSSGVGNTPKHFQEYAQELTEKFLKPREFIVEIGGNDGVLLSELRDVRTLNIEPATNIAPMAWARGVATINDFFTSDLARRVAGSHGKAQVVMGNNSIPHIGNQVDV
ncbi:MAG: SAM-dependent methyltransferase, partial [Patescibacteria group bacterium]